MEAARTLAALFAAMRTGDMFGADVIRWFNGGLFDEAPALPLERSDIKLIGDTAAEHDWSEIDPAIFGNLFEAALKATRERPALGAHYTDRDKILRIVDPVIVRPLTAEWEAALAKIKASVEAMAAVDAKRKAVIDGIAEKLSPSEAGQLSASERAEARVDKFNLEMFDEEGARELPNATRAALKAAQPALTAVAKGRDAAYGEARTTLEAFLVRLAAFRVLDPACGSGNFLYVALHALKDLERRALVDAERLGLSAPTPRVGLECVRGIEIEAYAAELARVTLWIGDLQWNARNNYTGLAEPILSSLDQIENRDALLNPDGTEAQWPAADVIVGNPPFLGGKRLRDGLGDATVERLFATYKGRVPAEADFVAYWVQKAWRAIEKGHAERAGVVATNSIRGGASRRVLDPIVDADALMEAWADEPWMLDGAAVRVSIICFGRNFFERRLDGQSIYKINADLTSSAADLTKAVKLRENDGVCFEGVQKYGEFELNGDLARIWLRQPLNPNGRPNSDVLRPYLNARDLVRRSDDRWIIDFGDRMTQGEAAFYELPYEQILKKVLPYRMHLPREIHRNLWWRHGWLRVQLTAGRKLADRMILTPVVAKHRIFSWAPTAVLPSNLLDVILRDDDTTFGILHSRFHELWSLRMGTSLEDRPRYTPSTTFETFPFPEGLTPNIPAADYAADPRAIAIADAARDLHAKREARLNPADLVRIESEVVPGYPDRILPKDEAAAEILKTRTLTNLYNQRPTWLADAHRTLDAAVAAAYGWPADLSDEAMLEYLFALNQERAAAGR